MFNTLIEIWLVQSNFGDKKMGQYIIELFISN